jgi:hypothetical protein
MAWAHTFNVEHDERCEVCGDKLELRMIGKDDWVFYCRKCLRHEIKKPLTEETVEEKNDYTI